MLEFDVFSGDVSVSAMGGQRRPLRLSPLMHRLLRGSIALQTLVAPPFVQRIVDKVLLDQCLGVFNIVEDCVVELVFDVGAGEEGVILLRASGLSLSIIIINHKRWLILDLRFSLHSGYRNLQQLVFSFGV